MPRTKFTRRQRLAVLAVAVGTLLIPLATTGAAQASNAPTTLAVETPGGGGGGAGGQAGLTPPKSGRDMRPYGSDGYWPAAGTWVSWTVVRPVQDLIDQGKAYGYRYLGTIGNEYHLKKHGDHTPWSYGKDRGRVYAIDTGFASEAQAERFENWLVAKCQSDYNTLWIDFFNINGSQYNNAGTRVASSGDYHFHVSVRRGYENARVTLLQDFHEWDSRN